MRTKISDTFYMCYPISSFPPNQTRHRCTSTKVFNKVIFFKTAVDPVCHSYPCQNGGTCTENEFPPGYSCKCYAGFVEPNCTDKDECTLHDSNVCHNGNCVNTIGSFKCMCNTGFTGSHCTYPLDVCQSSPCIHSGTCVTLEDGGYTCSCYAGYDENNNCEDMNECELSSSPLCKNNGSCVNTVGSFTCECQQGYGGKHCEKVVDECESIVPCVHGTCINHPGYFKCSCDNGYTGLYCDTRTAESTTASTPGTSTSTAAAPGTSTSTVATPGTSTSTVAAPGTSTSTVATSLVIGLTSIPPTVGGTYKTKYEGVSYQICLLRCKLCTYCMGTS